MKLLPQEKKSIQQTPTDNVEAYTFYLRGRQFMERHSKSNYQLARRMFAKAVELDPHYARAYAGIADCDSFLFLHYHVEAGIETFWPRVRRHWLWIADWPKLTLREDSLCRLRNDTMKQRRNSNGPSRWIQIRTRVIISTAALASPRVNWSRRPRFSSRSQKSSQTTTNH